jgi:hypothetical protein
MTTLPARWRLIASAALLAASCVLGGSAVGVSPTACAEPIKYDFLKYLTCANYWNKKYQEGAITEKELDQARRLCCASSGGDWHPSSSGGTCKEPAKPAEAQPTLPGEAPPPVVATENPTPPLPPIRNPGVIQTFTPTPVSPG